MWDGGGELTWTIGKKYQLGDVLKSMVKSLKQ